MSRPGARERGLSESLSWALIAPALLLVVLGIIEVAIWAHGRDVAGSAAAAGADVGSVRGGTVESARRAGLNVASAGGLLDVTIDVSRDVDAIRITVSGRAPQPLELGLGRVTETVRMPVERVS